MTTIDRYGFKILLPRLAYDHLLDDVKRQYAGECSQRWRSLAFFALHHIADWKLEDISFAFGYSTGHVSRIVSAVRDELEQILLDRAGSFPPPSETEEPSCEIENRTPSDS